MKKVLKRSCKSIENEIRHQIRISELCFDICNSIETIPGRGNDFLPYYYNLNFIKGIISLHSLLLSEEKDELSINNYISKYKWDWPESKIEKFEKDIKSISEAFKNTFPMPLRHKIGAHISESFEHTKFTSGYIMPILVPKYINIIKKLKKTFLEFCGWGINDYPFHRIKQQSDSILKCIKDSD